MIRKLLFFILYYSGLPLLLRRKLVNNKEIPVLLFHRISNNTDLLWPSMPVKSFENLVLKINQTCTIISFSDLIRMQSFPSKPIIILSFDDGYIDFFENVMPMFKRLNIKANHNICPGLIDREVPPWTQILSLYLSFKTSNNEVFSNKLSIAHDETFTEKRFIDLCKQLLQFDDEKRNALIMPLLLHVPKEKMYKLMNWEQIKYCAENNIEIGSHGYMHRNLLQVWDQVILENEINESGQKIEQILKQRPKVFAFANAMGNEESKKFVLNSGYQFALMLMDKLLMWSPVSADKKIVVPRINISRPDWREEYLRALGFHARIKQFLKV